MYNTLDRGLETAIANDVVEALEEGGYLPNESIPGLLQAVIILAEKCQDPEGSLDDAVTLLSDLSEE